MSIDMSNDSMIESLQKDLEMFAHTTSHDLKDPLRQAVYDIKELQDSASDTAAVEHLQQVSDSISTVITKIELLREYSHMVNDKSTKDDEIDCNHLLLEVMDDLEEVILATGAIINSDSLPTVTGNKKHLKRLFKELIENAIRFTGEASPLIEVKAQLDQCMWHFTIQDNGIGLDPIYQRIVMAIFQKLEPELDLDHFGVGLTFANKILQNHGGKLWFTGEDGAGTCFHFSLPK